MTDIIERLLHCRGRRPRRPLLDVEQSKKKTAHFRVRYVLALPIFPGSRPPSIVGANELNFCVRYGNRWTLIAINTNYIIKSFYALNSLYLYH